MQDFRKLKIWELAKNYSLAIYTITAKFSIEEKYGLTSQIRRSANSISANIAEGAGRNGQKDFARFIDIALGSLAETESFIELASELEYITTNDYRDLLELSDKLRRKCINFRKCLV